MIPYARSPCALSDQATFRVVLLTRSAELVEAAEHAHLIGAAVLELQPITSSAAAEYLLRPLIDPSPPGWQAIADELTTHRASPLTKTLDNPLTLTLLRDSYPPNGPVDELLDSQRFPTYCQPPTRVRPGRRGSWWHTPQWTPRVPRFLLSVMVTGPAFGFAVGLTFGVLPGDLAAALGVGSGFAFGFLPGLAGGLLAATLFALFGDIDQPSVGDTSSYGPHQTWQWDVATDSSSGWV